MAETMEFAEVERDALDPATVASLAEILPKDQVQDLARILIDDVESRLVRIDGLCGDGDVEALRRDAHDLRSSCGNFGLVETARLAAMVEAACRSGDGEGARQLARHLRPVAGRGLCALRELCGLSGAV
jgi:HPt (histidine-containing phosphotransfer) domain-containing protein